ncbi:phage integrase family protein [Methylothermus subterraneus]
MDKHAFHLGVSELAALRGWIVGLPAKAAVATFLKDFEGNAESLLKGWMERLALKARLAGRPDWARLLSQRPASEEKQREAVAIIEKLARLEDPRPGPDHPLDLWLPPSLAKACWELGFKTLGDLVPEGWRRLSGRSQAWVREWLVANGLVSSTDPVGVIASGSLAPAPIERLMPPEALDGRNGTNRAPGPPKIDAANDYEAIKSWLSLWPEGSHTWKAYRRESERFLLWCLVERGKAFSSVTAEDGVAYRTFLKDPRPADRWIGPPRPRTSKEWKPFRGPLSDRSVHQAEIILGALCQWLVGQRWLDSNPFAALPRQRRNARMRTDHALTEAQWRFVIAYSGRRIDLAQTEEKRRCAKRLRFVLEFAYLTGLRLSELAAARMGDIKPVVRRDSTQYWLTVIGKGGRPRRVPLPPRLVERLIDYLRDRGWRVDQPEQAPPDVPLVASIRRPLQVKNGTFARQESALTPLGLHHQIRQFFREAGTELAKQDPEAGRRLRAATCHWLRHTHGTHALDRGVPLTVVRDNLGHASIQTTSLYLHKDADERFKEMEKLMVESHPVRRLPGT